MRFRWTELVVLWRRRFGWKRQQSQSQKLCSCIKYFFVAHRWISAIFAYAYSTNQKENVDRTKWLWNQTPLLEEIINYFLFFLWFQHENLFQMIFLSFYFLSSALLFICFVEFFKGRKTSHGKSKRKALKGVGVGDVKVNALSISMAYTSTCTVCLLPCALFMYWHLLPIICALMKCGSIGWKTCLVIIQCHLNLMKLVVMLKENYICDVNRGVIESSRIDTVAISSLSSIQNSMFDTRFKLDRVSFS